jgi:hypothetical protein
MRCCHPEAKPKDLLLTAGKQILRFAQDDNVGRAQDDNVGFAQDDNVGFASG